MPDNESLVGQFCRRVAWWCFVRRAVAALTLWAFAWGTLVLVMRTVQGTSSDLLLWGAIGIPVSRPICAISAFDLAAT